MSYDGPLPGHCHAAGPGRGDVNRKDPGKNQRHATKVECADVDPVSYDGPRPRHHGQHDSTIHLLEDLHRRSMGHLLQAMLVDTDDDVTTPVTEKTNDTVMMSCMKESNTRWKTKAFHLN